MGRRRSRNLNLPPRMQQKGGAYYYTPYVAGKLKWIALGSDLSDALRQWAQHEGQHQREGTTVGHAIDRYLVQVLPTKAPATQKEYRNYSGELRRIFGDTALDHVRPTHVAQYLDRHHAKVLANRHISLLSSLFERARRWGWTDNHPCHTGLVHRNKETARKRYVTDAEFHAVRNLARPPIRCAMDLARLIGLRLGDILRLRLSDVRDDELHVTTSKTGKRMIYEITPSLAAVIAECKTLGPKNEKVRGLTLIVNRRGLAYTVTGFSSIWQRLQRKAIDKKLIESRYTFHDLRAKAGSEHHNAQELLGHDDPRTTNRIYRRLPRRVRPVDVKE